MYVCVLSSCSWADGSRSNVLVTTSIMYALFFSFSGCRFGVEIVSWVSAAGDIKVDDDEVDTSTVSRLGGPTPVTLLFVFSFFFLLRWKPFRTIKEVLGKDHFRTVSYKLTHMWRKHPVQR